MHYDTVIFDLDGTLMNTLEDLWAAVNYALNAMGLPARSREEVRLALGNGLKYLLVHSLPQGAGPEELRRATELFKEHYKAHMGEHTAPYPGVLELLRTLREKGCKLAVVSNKYDAAVKELVEEYFPGLIHLSAGESESRGIPRKPDPAMVLHVMEALGADPARTVYVGDSEVDLQTAKNAGLPCISVTWGFREQSFLEAQGGVRFAHSPAELLQALED